MAKKSPYFKKVTSRVHFPELEERIVKFWKRNKIFEKSVNSRSSSKGWTFLDGPPFITGLPHYGSLLSSIPKDLFPRFWTMKGYRIRRVWGWDCHGLPAENKVEEKLGLKRKRDIEEKVGVRKFIRECKQYVSEVSSEWEWYIDRVARWVDFKNAYKTMDKDYMETVMWVFKQIYDKGYIYKGLRVSLFCPHCSTPISNFEVAMDADNYRSVTEPGTVYKYPLKGSKDTFLLAWSTTPWNKIATPALAVNPELKYVKVKQGSEYYVLAKTTLGMLLKKPPYKVLEELKGKDLVGKNFIPHYDYYKIDKGKKAFIVAGGDFVTADEGTGIVTIAAYGEEDLDLMKRENIQVVLHVDDEGKLKSDVPKWAGMYYLDVNSKVNEDLSERGLIYRDDPHTHKMPTCWRCHTQLFYAPQDAWYMDIQKLKPRMKETNEKVNWYPAHFKHGRFLKSMEAAPDWCISRSRYWGSPVPVWECTCGERFVPGSIKDLEKASGKKITDLHKPGIDDITVKCEKCGKRAKRVPEVLDSWIEAGSASFAERHYPFEKGLDLKKFFPPDFIVEYTGQIRAWFYVLHVIANALLSSHAFKNVVVTGVILGSDGRKMSKNYGNYPDPKKMLETYGGDALRLYLMGSPVMNGEDILISEEHYRDQVRCFMLILWNVYNFFITYALVDGWSPDKKLGKEAELEELDRWMLVRLKKLKNNITEYLEMYNTVDAVNDLSSFVRDLSRWYVRRSRDRVGPTSENERAKHSFYRTCYYILVEFSKISAPFIPFLSEEMFKNLTNKVSVHIEDWPEVPKVTSADEKLIQDMILVRHIVEKAHALRKECNIPLRQPLSIIEVSSPSESLSTKLLVLLKDELNIERVEWKRSKTLGVKLDTKITPELRAKSRARELVRNIQLARRKQNMGLKQKVEVTNPWVPKEKDLVNYIKRKTLAKKLEKGEFKVIKTS